MVGLIGSLTGLVFVSLPIVWIVMHYRHKSESATGFNANDSKQLDELMDVAESMAERIKTLEAILDVETPEWRDNHGEL